MFQQGHSRLRLSSTLYGLCLIALVLGAIALFSRQQPPIADHSLPSGCKPAILKSVANGDEINILHNIGEATAWARSSVRLRGIVAPRQGALAGCKAERDMGWKAKNHLKFHLPGAHLTSSLLRICNAEAAGDDGHQVADVYLRQKGRWRSVAVDMVEAGYAFPTAQSPKASWCDCLEVGVCPPALRQRFKKNERWFD